MYRRLRLQTYTKENDIDSLKSEINTATNSKEKSTVASISKLDNQKDSKWILWASISISALCLGAISFLVTKIFKTKP